ncbi:MAG TPA: hypothetical protein VLE53_12625 [Gemmatimonadaceae bacterium]|nr:hypothetical protein [Gemmatimonadaceae bacterium]
MSIRASRLRFSARALATVAAVYVGVVGGLELMARHLETSGQVYPYKWEDWFRYLTPTLWRSDGRPGLMLTGPSTARENFLVEDFSTAFPGNHVIPGAMSLGTFRDITAGLEYVEAEHGRAALPTVLVLGISPRFIAEIPAERPFPLALERYGRRHGSLLDSSAAFGLARKSALGGTIDHLRFRLSRQSPRYRAVLAWLITRLIPADANAWLAGTRAAVVLSQSGVGQLLGVQPIVRAGPREFARGYISPYRYQPVHTSWRRAALEAALDDTLSWWSEVFRWDPDRDAAAVRARALALRRFTAERGVDLFVVNLPEHSALRRRTDPGFAARYDALIHAAFDSLPLLDLRCLLPDADFFDAEHASWKGAKEVSAHVVGFMQAIRAARVRSGGDRETLKTLSAQWSRGNCALDP